MHRATREPLAHRLAAVAGAVVGAASKVVGRAGYGILGVLCVSGGVWAIYRPAGVIVLGLAFLAIDRTN